MKNACLHLRFIKMIGETSLEMNRYSVQCVDMKQILTIGGQQNN